MHKTRLLLLALLVIGASMLVLQAASAAEVRNSGVDLADRLDKAKGELKLSSEQVAKIDAIRNEARTHRQAVLADKSLSQEVKRQRILENAKSTHEKVMNVLTPEQRTKWNEMVKKRVEERSEHVSTNLGLSPEQEAKVKAIREKEKADIKAVRADKKLSAAQKDARIKAIRADARDKFNKTLTVEQRQKLRSEAEGKRPRAKTK